MDVNRGSLNFSALQEKVVRFQKNHKKFIKIAAVVLTIIVALVFFVVKGEIQKKQEQLQLSEQIQSEQQDKAGKNQYAKEFEEKSKEGKEGRGGLVVDISGQVKKPGVYKMKIGDRINDLIEMAGGLTSEANVDNINRASKVEDGSKIYIPKNGESSGVSSTSSSQQTSSSNYSGSSGAKSSGKSDAKININTSDEETLKQIPGVGPSMAKKILDYRQSNGKFNSIEDLKNISGIGTKTFAKMQDYVVV